MTPENGQPRPANKKYVVSETAIEQAHRCPHGFRCLTDGPHACCEVDMRVSRRYLAVKPKQNHNPCCFSIDITPELCGCSCPVRHEIHERYGV